MDTALPALPPGLSAQFEVVTPDGAREWMKFNLRNRRVRRGWAKYLSDQLKSDRWAIMGDAIAFSKDGVLINGQHRLLAIIDADRPAVCLVVRGLTEEAFLTTDRGIGKSVADVLRQSHALMADASLCYRFIRATAGRIAEVDQRDIAVWWGPAHEVLVRNVTFTRGLSSSALRLGFGARWAMQQQQELRAFVDGQFKALLANDTDLMCKATATLWKRTVQDKWGVGAMSHRMAGAAITFYYTDPERAYVAPLIRDLPAAIEELRSVLLRMEEAYVAAPKNAAHPYLFERQVRVSYPRPSTRRRSDKTDNRPLQWAASAPGP